MTVYNLIQTGTTCKNYTYIPSAMFNGYIINSFNSASISTVFVMGVFLVGLVQFRIVMEVLRKDLKNNSNTNGTSIQKRKFTWQSRYNARNVQIV